MKSKITAFLFGFFAIGIVSLGVAVLGVVGLGVANYFSPAVAQSEEERVSSAPSGDVPYVPTPQVVVDKMLEIAKVKPSDYVIDLGSGDGRIVLTAVRKYGAKGHGVELNKDRVRYSEEQAKKYGVSHRARFKAENIFDTDLSKATVVTMYLLGEVNLKMRPRILSELKPGTRVISHAFDMGNWEPDLQVSMPTGELIYAWMVPAKVEGEWPVLIRQGRQVMQVNLKQNFQNIEGTARVNGELIPIEEGKVKGNVVSFKIDHSGGELAFQGRRHKGRMVGSLMPANSDRLPASVQ